MLAYFTLGFDVSYMSQQPSDMQPCTVSPLLPYSVNLWAWISCPFGLVPERPVELHKCPLRVHFP